MADGHPRGIDPSKPLHEYQCYATQVEGNQRLETQRWVGRCVEFPDLRTGRHKYKLDAIDAIVAKVRDRVWGGR